VVRKVMACTVAVAVLLVGPLALPAQAYVDPGTGSFIFQAVIGGALAAGVALKVFWKRITGVFSRKDEAPAADE
jgi:hypothetical protein